MIKGFSKTQILTLAGAVSAVAAAVLGVIGKIPATLFFLSLAVLTLIAAAAVIHRYLVNTRAASNRQFEKVRKLVEEQSDLNSVVLSESGLGAVHSKDPVTPVKKSKKAGQPQATPAKKSKKAGQPQAAKTKEQAKGQPVPSSVSPLESGMISVKDREAEVARSISKAPKAASRFALKVKSRNIRDNFARAASGNLYTYSQLISILRSLREDDLSDFDTVKSWDADVLLALAHVLGNQRLNESDLEDARTILVVVAAVFGKNKLSREDRLLLSEIVGECGDWETAAYMLETLGLKKSNPVQYHFTVANQFAGKPGHAEHWLNAVNTIYRASGLNLLEFSNDNMTHLDQLEAESLSSLIESESRPLVSVIVPTFEGAPRIRTALSSLAAQSWKNHEILVIDDGSSEENVNALKKIIAEYPTAKLVHLDENRGAYVARNEGLRLAKGEFVTVHDDDDWSHPQKIAKQVEYLLENPELVGSISKHARVTEELRFTRINRRPEFSQNNMSSLLVRTEDARAMGGWHEVNRGADEEFTLRLQKAVGKKIGCCSETPLSFTRTHERSLTSGEILRGFQNPSRMLYHSAFTTAHRGIGAGNTKLEVKALPADMEGNKRGTDFGVFDFGYVLDAKLDDVTQASAVAELRSLDSLGYRVAIVHHHSFEGSALPLVNQRVLTLLEETGVQFFSFQNIVRFDYLIVRDARAFEFAEETTSKVSAEEILFVAPGKDLRDPMQGALGRKALAGVCQVFGKQEADIRILDDWAGLSPFGSRQTRTLDPDSKPVIGRGRAPKPKNWPGKISEIKGAYTGNEVYDVLLVDDFDDSSARVESLLREGAELVSLEEYDFADLTERLDFWVDMGEPHTRPSLEVLSAMSEGLVVVMRPGSEETYGDGALYVKPDGLPTVVKRMLELPELYELQQERAVQHLPRLWDSATFEAYISDLREN
mgnify:CR=1 FL=1